MSEPEKKIPESDHIEAHQLFAYLERHLSFSEEKKVLSHIRSCDQCKGELKRAHRLARVLGDLSYVRREKCPTAETMEAYYEGKLSARDVKKVKRHIDWCHYCSTFEKVYESFMVNKDRRKGGRRKKA